MKGRIRLFLFSSWRYLNQPILGKGATDSTWNPRHFWYGYRVKLLKSCWRKAIPSESRIEE